MSDPQAPQRYRIEEFLGAGGNGQVYRAWDSVLNRQVAFKLLRSSSEETLEVALREARSQAQVAHPNLCKVFDVGEQNGKPFIASELIEGPSLETPPSLDTAQIVELVRDVALAIEAAHQQGLVHRDLKPQNVLLESSTEPIPKVVDFGIATQLSDATDEAAKVYRSTGTPAYMAPEQIRGGKEARAPSVDIYALGGLLHQLLSGSPAFSADTEVELLKKVLQQDPPRLRSKRPDLAADLDAIVFRCLEKVPARRYSTALAFAEDLDRYLAGKPVLAVPQTARYRTIRFVQRNRALVAIGALAVVGASLFGGLWLRQISRSEQQARIARDFGAQAEQLGAQLQLVYLSPTEDLVQVRGSVQATMRELARRARDLGALASGPAESALGLSSLRLGAFEEAASHFEKAWVGGYQEPEVALGLGEAKARLYAEELRTLYYLAPTVRKLRADQLREQLLLPALERLRFGLQSERSASRNDLAYLTALEAFLEGRFDELPALAQKALRREPFRYEAGLLEGYAARSAAVQADLAGEPEKIRPLLQRALAAFEAAAQIARSDPRVFQEICITEEALIYDSMRQSMDDSEEVSSACQRAIDLDPREPGPFLARAGVLQRLAVIKARRGSDPKPTLNKAREYLERSLGVAPQNPNAHLLMATQYTIELDLRSWHDAADRTSAASQAIFHAKQTESFAPDSVWAPFVLGQTHYLFAEIQSRIGEDPTPTVAAAKQYFERAIQLAPDVGRTYATYGSMLDWFSSLQFESLGQDPTANNLAAKSALQKAAKLEPNNAVPMSLLSVAYMTRARYLERTGQDPLSEVQAGDEALVATLELRPQSVVALSNRSELWLIALEFALREGDPEPAYAMHRKALEQAADLDPDEFGCSLAKSDWYRARIEVAQDRDPSAAIERGLVKTAQMFERVGLSRYCQRDRARLLLEKVRYLAASEAQSTSIDSAWNEGVALLDAMASRNERDRELWRLRGAYHLFAAQRESVQEEGGQKVGGKRVSAQSDAAHSESGTKRRHHAQQAAQAFGRSLEYSPGHAETEGSQRLAIALAERN